MKEEMILRALRMIGERRDYWDKQTRNTSSASDCATAIAYDSAFAILEAAISGNSSFLDSFDYYGEE
jgi:hypothetical protein